MFKTSEQTDKLDAQLAKAQGEIDSAKKEKTNPAFRSKYADIAAVWDACRDALSRNQISVTQWPVHSDGDRLHLITRLAHAGQWMMGEISLPVMKKDAHGYGSAVTYAKRFALAAAIGVVADDEHDDDGNGASAKQDALRPVLPPVSKPAPAFDPLAAAQKKVGDAARRVKMTAPELAKLSQKLFDAPLTNLTEDQLSELSDVINRQEDKVL